MASLTTQANRTAPAATPGMSFFGHPRGIIFLAGTEFWERVSFHGMQALLVLYMVERLLLPGHVEHILGFSPFRSAIERVTGTLSVQALASQIFGLYLGLVYLVPVLGGALGDRWLGRRRAVMIGALAMTAGHFCMAFEPTFLMALALLILGTGLLRGNLISQFGDLYSKDDPRRGGGFQIYYFMLALGAFCAPLVTGALAAHGTWDRGFTFAGIGMLAGVVLYQRGRRYVPAEPTLRSSVKKPPLRREERRIVLGLIAMLPLLVGFWIAQTQIWNTYNLWVRDHVDLRVGRLEIPVPWLQAIDSLAVIAFVPLMLQHWKRQRARGCEPDDVRKLALGCIFFGAAIGWLAGAQVFGPKPGAVPLLWAIGYHFLSGAGYVYFAPTAVALYSRVAPAAVNALMVGIYFLAIFAGSTISGRLGGLYEHLSQGEFWGLHASLVAGSGAVLLILSTPVRRFIGLQGAPPSTSTAPVCEPAELS